MPLTEPERFEVWARYMRRQLALLGLTKVDLRAAVNAVDDWIEANQTVFNLALPQPFRGAADFQEKSLLLAAVALKRAGINL